MNISHDHNFIELQKSPFTNYKARIVNIFYDYNNYILDLTRVFPIFLILAEAISA